MKVENLDEAQRLVDQFRNIHVEFKHVSKGGPFFYLLLNEFKKADEFATAYMLWLEKRREEIKQRFQDMGLDVSLLFPVDNEQIADNA